jgi:hypothetical protein
VKRKKQNPIDDLAKNVGGWLGGAARTFADLTDSSRDNAPREKGTQKFIEGSRMIGRAADVVSGGVGSAALRDARSGSNVPSNLYKTAAVNLAAGAVGFGAAKTAQRVVANAPKARTLLGQSFRTVPVAEEFPRLNKKQLALLREVEKGGPDIAKNLYRSAATGDVASVLEDVPRFSKLKSSDLVAVADRLSRQSQASLKSAGFGDTIKVWRTQSVDSANAGNDIVSVTTRKGGIKSFQKPTNVTNAAKIRRSDVLAEYVTPRGSSQAPYLEQEILVSKSSLKRVRGGGRNKK